jgi:bisphosphoglycerate-independent phosphoglycerate mutase (AlkP superfamily)
MHTLNPALCITAGENAGQLSKRIKNLSNIKPSIMEMYD